MPLSMTTDSDVEAAEPLCRAGDAPPAGRHRRIAAAALGAAAAAALLAGAALSGGAPRAAARVGSVLGRSEESVKESVKDVLGGDLHQDWHDVEGKARATVSRAYDDFTRSSEFAKLPAEVQQRIKDRKSTVGELEGMFDGKPLHVTQAWSVPDKLPPSIEESGKYLSSHTDGLGEEAAAELKKHSGEVKKLMAMPYKDMVESADFEALPERVQNILKKHHAVQQKLRELHHAVGDANGLISKGKSLTQKFSVPSDFKSVVESGEEHLPSGIEDSGREAAAELKKHSKEVQELKEMRYEDMLKSDAFAALPEGVQKFLEKHHEMQEKLQKLHASAGDLKNGLTKEWSMPSDLQGLREELPNLPEGVQDFVKEHHDVLQSKQKVQDAVHSIAGGLAHAMRR